MENNPEVASHLARDEQMIERKAAGFSRPEDPAVFSVAWFFLPV